MKVARRMLLRQRTLTNKQQCSPENFERKIQRTEQRRNSKETEKKEARGSGRGLLRKPEEKEIPGRQIRNRDKKQTNMRV